MTTTIVSLALLFVLLAHGAQGLSCFCRRSQCGDIDLLKQRCKGGLVDDVCHCCKTCAKVEGETCGGFWGFEGTCDQGLFCKGGHPSKMTRGICTLKTTTTPSRETTEIPVEAIEKAESRDDLDLGSGDEESEQTEETEYSSGDDKNEFPTTAEKMLTTTESSFSGDESGDDSDGWIWLPTAKPEPTVQMTEKTEMPTSSEDDENEFPTTREKILTTTDSSYSGDESGDESDDEDDELTERRTSTEWAWLPTAKPEPTVQMTEETEMPTSREDDENEKIVIF